MMLHSVFEVYGKNDILMLFWISFCCKYLLMFDYGSYILALFKHSLHPPFFIWPFDSVFLDVSTIIERSFWNVVLLSLIQTEQY